ncbi:High-affinity branched-chain amino acid transport system permease protein LivH [subsurface metagenome]
MLQQFIVNNLIAGCIYALIALGFAVIYRTVRFFHFAHGIVFTVGAYFAFLFKMWLGCPLWIAILGGILLAGVLGCLMEVVVYRPLRKRDSSELVLLLASLGIYILLQNVISMIFGDDTKSIRISDVQEGINILGARITPIQIVTICVSIVLVIALSAFLKKSKIGKTMRAVANDPMLADISGINSNRIILCTFAIGSGLAAIAGILVALDVDMTPTMGMNALMMGVVVVIIGGVNSIPGIALGALLLAMSQHFGAWFIGSQWQDAIAFIILVLFLLFKPEGFFGKKVKSATV